MTDHSPTDLTNPSYAELLAKIALLEQQQKQQQDAYQQRLQEQQQQYEKQLKAYQVQIEHLIEKQKLLIHQLFGQKNEALTPKQDHLGKESALEDLSALEQIKDNAQAELDNDSHTASTNESVNTDSQMLITQSESKQTDTNSDDNKPAKPKRERRIVIPDNLEVRTIIHEPESITCGCGCQMKQIGEDVQDKLGLIPACFYRERHIYPKYACQHCQRQSFSKQPIDDTQNQNHRLIQAKVPAGVIVKSIATAELLAHIIISKFADHQPLYRQSLIYGRSGVHLSDSTMADWVGRCGVALEPLVKRLHELLLTQPILHADETPVNILKFNNNKGKLKQGYVWAYLTPQHCQSYGGFKAVVYDFAESRRNEHPKAFLDKWQGHLICDDYNGYKCLFKQKQAVIEVGCMAHARRKFHELHIKGQSLVAHEALALFQKLYAVECQIDALFEKNETPSPRVATTVVAIRQQHAKPIAKALYRWLQEKRLGTTKNASITKAIEYCLKRWQALTRYLEDGSLPIDMRSTASQGAEMRPWALGRKNWLFAGSLKSGQRAAVIMSLIQSARLNGLDVYAYLSDVLKRLPTHKDKDIDELLPHVWKMQ